MSRWKSPPIAAKRAERASKQAEQLRKEKRNSRLMIIGVAVVMIGLGVAEYFWLKARAQQRREEHQKIHHRQVQTNSLASQAGGRIYRIHERHFRTARVQDHPATVARQPYARPRITI